MLKEPWKRSLRHDRGWFLTSANDEMQTVLRYPAADVGRCLGDAEQTVTLDLRWDFKTRFEFQRDATCDLFDELVYSGMHVVSLFANRAGGSATARTALAFGTPA